MCGACVTSVPQIGLGSRRILPLPAIPKRIFCESRWGSHIFHGIPHAFQRGYCMASPNYSGEKRRKDLAKQAKKKEKLAKKLQKNRPSDPDPAHPNPENT